MTSTVTQSYTKLHGHTHTCLASLPPLHGALCPPDALRQPARLGGHDCTDNAVCHAH